LTSIASLIIAIFAYILPWVDLLKKTFREWKAKRKSKKVQIELTEHEPSVSLHEPLIDQNEKENSIQI
jgi:hypothetical protein